MIDSLLRSCLTLPSHFKTGFSQFKTKMFRSGFLQSVPLFLLVLTLGGCDIFGKSNKIPLEGKRELVLLDDLIVTPDHPGKAPPVLIPEARENESWPMASGNARHVMEPVAMNSTVTEAWRLSIGQGTGRTSRLLNGPLIAEKKVFAVDAEGHVSAVELESGTRIWERSTLSSEGGLQAFSGGLAYEEGLIYVTTSGAEILALKATDGEILWRKTISAPARSAPTVSEGRLFVVTINNKIEALDAKSGTVIWSHSGIIETAGLLGGASPAVYGGVVVVPYSSGEIFALRAENGFPLWSESFSAFNRLDSVSSLAHIKARPLIDQGKVFLVSHSGRTGALDLKSGKMLWSRNFGGIRTPAVAGDFLFMVTKENTLLCLTTKEGWIVWATRLPDFENPEKREGKILWAGPVVVGDQLVLAGSNGQAMFVSASEGKITKTLALSEPTTLSPIAAHRTLVFLTERANLVVYR